MKPLMSVLSAGLPLKYAVPDTALLFGCTLLNQSNTSYYQIIKSFFLQADIIIFFDMIYCQISDRELRLMPSIPCIEGL
jgi:hypothetical protein